MPVVVAPVIIAWGVFMLALLLWALSQAGQTAIRSFFETIARVIPSIPVISSILGKGIDWMIRHTVKPISDAALAVEAPIAGFFSHAAAMIERSAFSAYYTAVHTYDALYKLRHAVIPSLIHAATLPIKIVAHAGSGLARVTWHNVLRVVTNVRTLARTAYADAIRAERFAAQAWRHAEAGAIAAPIPWVGREIGSARDLAQRALDSVRGLRKRLAAAAIGGAAIYALGRIGAGWLKCSNWQKIGRQGCRMPGHLLDDLLALVTDFFVLTNICAVIPWLEAGFSEVAEPLIGTLTRAGAGLCRGSAGPPETLPEPALYLPAGVSASVYLP